MSEFKCPIDSCGRILESANVLKQHIRRRHPGANLEAINAGQEEKVIQQEISKLPKIRTLKMQVGEHKLPQIHKRSSSKNKLDVSTNSTKMTSVISESRSIVQSTQRKPVKKPSLNKHPSSNNSAKQDRLPQLKQMIRPKKLEGINEHLKLKKSDSEGMETNIMYSTAPNFKKLQIKQSKHRQKSKQKVEYATYQVNEEKKQASSDLFFIKTQQGFHEKQVKTHKLLRRPQNQSVIIEPKVQKQQISKTTNGKDKDDPSEKELQPQAQKKSTIRQDSKIKNRRQASLKRPSKPETVRNYNFQQRIIVFDSNIGPKLTIPPSAKVQFIYANNCKLSFVSLGGIEFLRQISLQHNLLNDLSFLSYAGNGNIEKLYVDHNQLTSIDYLPPSLKVLSATFNNISGLQMCSKQLSRLLNLQQADFSFNPLRKEANYKLHLLSACLQLKKIDGMKITKFDLQLASEYSRMLDEQLGLIPSQKSKDLIISRCSQSPSTVISSGEQPEPQDTSQQQLLKQIGKLQKAIKHTKTHLSVIRNENDIIQAQIDGLDDKEENQEKNIPALFNKLRAEQAALELLKFFKDAGKQELEKLIEKKRIQVQEKMKHQ